MRIPDPPRHPREDPAEIFEEALSYCLEREQEWVAREFRERFRGALLGLRREEYQRGRTDALREVGG